MRPDLEVDSAGLRVAIPISEEVRRYLSTESADEYLKRMPEDLTGKPLELYNIIIAMQQVHKDAILSRCPECEGKIVVWNIEDPYFMNHEDAERIYKQIEGKIEQLAKSL
jgi:protein-tyrosine-phosphatase